MEECSARLFIVAVASSPFCLHMTVYMSIVRCLQHVNTQLVALHRYTIGMSHATYACSLAFISLAIADEL